MHAKPLVTPVATIVALLLAVAGCQPSDASSATEDATSPGAEQQAPADGPPLRVGEIVSVTAVVTGARDTIYEGSSQAGNVEPGGGCRSDGLLRMGFTFVPPDHSSESWFRWEVGTPMAPGATGSFRVEKVSYWYPGLGLPSRNSYEGSGTLEITRHDARRGAQRMTGRLTGQGLVDIDGQTVDVDVSFDMGGSCGTER